MAKTKTETVATKKENKEIALIEKLDPAVLFGHEHETLENILLKIKDEVATIVPDVTTAKGRKEITANVSRVTKSKTTLEKMGKDHVAAQKEALKAFDARRKHAKDFLEDLQKEVRKPLTDWEEKEKSRIEKCEGIVNAFIQSGIDSDNWMNYTLEDLYDLLQSVDEVTITKRLAEYEDQAQTAKNEAIKKINSAIQSRIKYDEDQAELEKLRAQAAENDRIRFESDQAAELERVKRQAEIEANNAKKEAERILAETQAQAEKDKILAEENAAKAERDRIEAEKQAEIEAEKVRAANTAHKGKINRAIVKELLKCGIDEDQAKKVVTAIAKNKVPNVKISY